MGETKSAASLMPASSNAPTDFGDGGVSDPSPAGAFDFASNTSGGFGSAGALPATGGLDGFGGFGQSFITDSVGRGQVNQPNDVFAVSSVLSENGFMDQPVMAPSEDFFRGVEAGQQKLSDLTGGGLQVDGIVNPDGPTEIVTQRAVTHGALNAPESLRQFAAPKTRTPPETPTPATGKAPAISSPAKHQVAAKSSLLRSAATPGAAPGQQARAVQAAKTHQAKAKFAEARQAAQPPRPSIQKLKEQRGLAPPTPKAAKPKPFIDPMDGATGEPGADKATFRRLRRETNETELNRFLNGLEDEVRNAAGDAAADQFRKQVAAHRQESREKLERENRERKEAENQRGRVPQPEIPTGPDPQTKGSREPNLLKELFKSFDEFMKDIANAPSETPPLDPPDAGPPPPLGGRSAQRPRKRLSGKRGSALVRFFELLKGRNRQ